LLITGIKKINEIKREHEAAINRYKNIDILNYLEFSDSVNIASVELFSAISILFRQFIITK
jgi:hypothetical protein